MQLKIFIMAGVIMKSKMNVLFCVSRFFPLFPCIFVPTYPINSPEFFPSHCHAKSELRLSTLRDREGQNWTKLAAALLYG